MAILSVLGRILPTRVGIRRFGAIASPHGLHVVEYVRQRDGVSLEAGIRQAAPVGDATALADALADAMESLGGRGGELMLALGGFGTAHHILTLPQNDDDDVLRPIVRRELLRYYPKLDDPEIGFVRGTFVNDASPRKREVLVGAVPRKVAGQLSRRLAERGVELRHLTVLPEVLQALYDTFGGDAGPSVMVVATETGLLIGCFFQGALRLFIEPPQDVHGRPVRDPESVIEQVERASLFLRQQFPSAGGARILLAAPEGEYGAVASSLESEMEAEVTPLSDAPGGSLAALGAALDAETARPLQVLPPELQPRPVAEQWTRRLAAAAALVVMVAAVWWAGAGVTVARVEADRARAVEARVQAEMAWLTATEETLEARRAHAERVALLETTTARGAEPRRILGAVAAAAPSAIQLGSLTVESAGEGGWTVSLSGRAEGASSAAAVRAIDALYRGIPARLPAEEPELGELRDLQETEGDTELTGGAAGGGAPVAIGFDMSFIVQWPTDSTR